MLGDLANPGKALAYQIPGPEPVGAQDTISGVIPLVCSNPGHELCALLPRNKIVSNEFLHSPHAEHSGKSYFAPLGGAVLTFPDAFRGWTE